MRLSSVGHFPCLGFVEFIGLPEKNEGGTVCRENDLLAIDNRRDVQPHVTEQEQ